MVNVLPLNDDREHDLCTACWCEPRVEWAHPDTGAIYGNGPLVVHNAADCREACEVVTGESLAPEKRWHFVSDDDD